MREVVQGNKRISESPHFRISCKEGWLRLQIMESLTRMTMENPLVAVAWVARNVLWDEDHS